MVVRVDGDGVDLAQRRRFVVVHLRPAEARHLSVHLVEKESSWFVPPLRLAGLQVLDRHVTLLGVPFEGSVVHCEEGRGVVGGERTGGQVGLQRRQLAAEPQQVAAAREACCRGHLVALGSDLLDPVLEASASLHRHGLRRRFEHPAGSLVAAA